MNLPVKELIKKVLYLNLRLFIYTEYAELSILCFFTLYLMKPNLGFAPYRQ